MKFTQTIITAAFVALASSTAFADALRYDGFNYRDDVTITGLKDGELLATVKSAEKTFDLDKVEWIELTGQPNFNAAELARKDDPKKAAALYKTALQNINDRKLKILAELRAVAPNDADGKFSDAVADFLDAYQASPTDSVWKLHPSNIPASPSTMLKESADRINARVSSFKTEDAKKNLKTFELEILTKGNDPRAAALAKVIGTGTAETPAATPNAAPTPAEPSGAVIGGSGLQGVSDAVKSKNYDAALTQADGLLKTATGDTAVRLFELKAQAYVGQKKLDLAAATLLRVIAHYPSSPNVIPDLMQAAELEKALKHDDEAKHLLDEVTAIRNRPRN